MVEVPGERPLRFIQRDDPGIEALLDSLAAEPRLALDTESDSFHRYFEKLCLVQFSTPGLDVFLDPLEEGLPDAVRALLEAPDRVLVVHAAEGDVRALRRAFGLTLGRIFDSAVAAALLGAPARGLKALLEAELQVVIDKSEQRSDWARRPLARAQLDYARQDTRWLLPLADRLAERLDASGRLPWHDEECELLRARTFEDRPFDPEGWRRLPGARTLGARGRRALRGMFLWRDALARELDRAPFRVAHNEAMSAAAARFDREGPAEAMRRQVPALASAGPARERLGVALEEALGGPDPGKDAPARSTPGPASPPLDAAAKARLERCRAFRVQQAAALGLDPGLLLPGAALERLAREPPADLGDLARVGALTRWRVELLGAGLLDALRAA
jgi:ribonuclease D